LRQSKQRNAFETQPEYQTGELKKRKCAVRNEGPQKGAKNLGLFLGYARVFSAQRTLVQTTPAHDFGGGNRLRSLAWQSRSPARILA